MARKLIVELIGDASSLEKAFKKSSAGANRFGKDMSKTARGAAAGSGVFKGFGRSIAFASGGFLGAAGLAAGVRAAFGEMADGQKVAAQTTAVLKSTGGAANVTAKQVDDLAQSLLAKSGVDDEAIKSGENLLLTFTNVRNEIGKGNDIFTQATKLGLDMSVALGQDASQSALQLGKALNDPIKGITALRRVGVSFTASQQDEIKALVKSGKTLQAQRLILAELRKEFGGSAEAAGKTLPGQLNKLRETALNLGGAIAQRLAPTIERLLTRLNKWLSSSQNQKKIMDTLTSVGHALAAVISTLTKVFDGLNRVTGSSANTIKLLIGAFVAFKALKMASNVAGVARSFGLLGTNAGVARTGVAGLRGSLIGKAGLVGAAGLAAFELTSLGLKLTGLDKKLRTAGGAAFDLAGKLGLVNDPGKQFEGKTLLSQRASAFIRRRAARLELRGLSESQAASRIAATHPNLATRDIGVLAHFGSHALLQRAAAVVVPVTVELDGRVVARVVASHQTKRSNREPTQTRGRQTR